MKTIDDIDVNNQRVLLRADLNAPMKQDANGVMQISDDGRLKASVATINDLRKRTQRLSSWHIWADQKVKENQNYP